MHTEPLKSRAAILYSTHSCIVVMYSAKDSRTQQIYHHVMLFPLKPLQKDDLCIESSPCLYLSLILYFYLENQEWQQQS